MFMFLFLLTSNVLFNCLTNASLSQQNKLWIKIGNFTSIMTFLIIPSLALLRALISDRAGISWSSAGIIDGWSTNAAIPGPGSGLIIRRHYFYKININTIVVGINFIKLIKFIKNHQFLDSGAGQLSAVIISTLTTFYLSVPLHDLLFLCTLNTLVSALI